MPRTFSSIRVMDVIDIKHTPPKASGLCYRLDNTVLGYAIVITAVLLIYTIMFFPGIRKDGFNIFLESSPILEFVSFDKLVLSQVIIIT